MFEIQAEIDDVYKAISTEEGYSKWWTREVKFEPRLNGIAQFKFGDIYLKIMKISRLSPPNILELQCLSGPDEWVGTKLSFILTKVRSNSTKVNFSHSDWLNDTEFFANCNFQWGQFLNSLRHYCEKGVGHPY